MRAAIYFVPDPDTPLAMAAARWLGRDIATGARYAPETEGGLDAAEIADATASPRHYGFHATLKAPFRLAAGHDLDGLADALTAFCRTRAAVAVAAPRVARLGPYLAITAGGDEEPLTRLAADVVRAFDGFRAPLTEDERARRRPETLSEAQRRHLDRWGYPHVMEDFRFHMTLAGPVPAARMDAFAAVLEARFVPLLAMPVAVDRLAVCVEADNGAGFAVHTVARLTG